MDAAQWIDLVLARSQEMRQAGVTSIGFQGCTASLGPMPIELPAEDKTTAQVEPPIDWKDDPASYPDGIVPGYQIQRLNDGGF